MSDMIKIAVDAMGGDGSPKKIIDGIILNHSTNRNNFFSFLMLVTIVDKKSSIKFSDICFEKPSCI